MTSRHQQNDSGVGLAPWIPVERESAPRRAAAMGKRVVVVDTDAGSDDAVALLLLLAFEPDSDYVLEGITCTHGNTTLDNVCRNVLITLESMSRTNVPVYRGAEQPLISYSDPNVVLSDFHGKDGFGDLELPPPLRMKVEEENAIPALNRIAAENDGLILICLGPLTNIALTLRTYPEFGSHLAHVYIMGGNVTGMGNTTKAAEFNFYKDPEAAHIVLSSLACPITLLPWEPCTESTITTEERLERIGKMSSQPHMRLINALDGKLYRNLSHWNPCDAILVAVFLDEGVVRSSRSLHLSVELHGLYTRGQVIVDHVGTATPNVRAVDRIDYDVFRRLITKMAGVAVHRDNT